MGSLDDICVSTFQLDPACAEQGGEGPGYGTADCTTLANRSMVPTDVTTAHPRTSDVSLWKESAHAEAHKCNSSASQDTSTFGRCSLREASKAQGGHGETLEIMCSSWRDSTERQYASYLDRRETCCLGRNCDPFRASVGEVLLFLTELYRSGIGYSAIYKTSSALSAVVQTVDDKPIGAHPKVIRFIKEVFELQTPLPRYNQTWDVSVVLKSCIE